MKIKKNELLQYIAIYWMLILNQSNLYRYFLRPYRVLLLIIMAGLFFFRIRKKTDMNTIYLMFMLTSVVFVRLWAGGTGLETYADYAVPIIATLYALTLNRECFVSRFIKLSVFMCICSLIGTIISYIVPQIIRLIGIQFLTGSGVSTWTSATEYTMNYYKGYGLFLYSWIDRTFGQRNISIFTEPGIYQMMINTALYMLLFMRKWIKDIDYRRSNRYLVVLLVALATCQSTTGFIVAGAIFIGALWNNDEISIKLKKRITTSIGIVVLLFIVDYFARGEKSILNAVILKKLVDADGAFSLAASSSGEARLGTIAICLQSIFLHPLGLGTVKTATMILNASDANVAGALVAFGATMGVVPFVVTMMWIFSPVFRAEISKIAKWIFVFMYINTTLAQSSIFYPALIIVPIALKGATKNDKIC